MGKLLDFVSVTFLDYKFNEAKILSPRHPFNSGSILAPYWVIRDQ